MLPLSHRHLDVGRVGMRVEPGPQVRAQRLVNARFLKELRRG